MLLGADANHKGWDIDSLFADGDVLFLFVLEECSGGLDVFGILGIILLALEDLKLLIKLFLGEVWKLSKVQVNFDLLGFEFWAVHVEVEFIRFLIL